MWLAKTFKLTERFNLQFRGEFYNAFNHSNYYINAGNLDVEDGTGVTAIQAVKGIPRQLARLSTATSSSV